MLTFAIVSGYVLISLGFYTAMMRHAVVIDEETSGIPPKEIPLQIEYSSDRFEDAA
jgi:hypothetical protein